MKRCVVKPFGQKRGRSIRKNYEKAEKTHDWIKTSPSCCFSGGENSAPDGGGKEKEEESVQNRGQKAFYQTR